MSGNQTTRMKRHSLRWIAVTAGWLLAVMGLQAQSSAPNGTVLMRLTGQQSGDILGEVTQKGREGMHAILAFSHEIVSPRDPASGLPSGKRQHHPFRVVKLLNRATPTLLNVLSKNELLTTVIVDVWAPSATGAEVKVITYTLTNAHLISIRPWMPNTSDATARGYPPAEELAFTYETLKVSYPTGPSEAQDDWTGGS